MHHSRVQSWSTLPKVDSNVAWFTLKSSSILVFIFGFLSPAVTLSFVSGFILMDVCVVLSPVSRGLPRVVLLLRSLHQSLSTVYLWVECYLLPLQVLFSLRYCLPSGLFSRFLVVRPNHLALGQVEFYLPPAHKIQLFCPGTLLVRFHLTSLWVEFHLLLFSTIGLLSVFGYWIFIGLRLPSLLAVFDYCVPGWNQSPLFLGFFYQFLLLFIHWSETSKCSEKYALSSLCFGSSFYLVACAWNPVCFALVLI